MELYKQVAKDLVNNQIRAYVQIVGLSPEEAINRANSEIKSLKCLRWYKDINGFIMHLCFLEAIKHNNLF